MIKIGDTIRFRGDSSMEFKVTGFEDFDKTAVIVKRPDGTYAVLPTSAMCHVTTDSNQRGENKMKRVTFNLNDLRTVDQTLNLITAALSSSSALERPALNEVHDQMIKFRDFVDHNRTDEQN